MAKKTAVDPAASLAKAIVESLVRRRSENAGYPASLREVASDVAADISETDLRAALAKAPLKTRAVLSFDGDLDSLAVLNDKEDIKRLAEDERLLRLLCETLCSPQLPMITVKEMAAAGILAKKLVTPFKSHWAGRLKSGTLPSFVNAVSVRGKTAKATEQKLHDLRFPLPWLTLSTDLVRALKPPAGSLGVITEWSTLLAQVPGAAPETYTVLARASEPFQSQVIPVFAKEPNGWLVLSENADRGARDPRILDRIFQSMLKAGDTAVELGALIKQKLLSPLLSPAFSRYVDKMSVNCPAGFGILHFAKRDLLFRLRDVTGCNPGLGDHLAVPHEPEVVRPIPTPSGGTTFAEAFDDAFARLDASDGGYNFVKLRHLRLALPQYGRAEFDAGLHTLRLARRYSLMPSEGNGISLSDQEHEAGIQEAGSRLVYCKKRG